MPSERGDVGGARSAVETSFSRPITLSHTHMHSVTSNTIYDSSGTIGAPFLFIPCPQC